MAKTEITAGVGRAEGQEAHVIAWVIVNGEAQPVHAMTPLEARLFASLLVAMADKTDYENTASRQADDREGDEQAAQRRQEFKVINGGRS